jgi:hypothetical protein
LNASDAISKRCDLKAHDLSPDVLVCERQLAQRSPAVLLQAISHGRDPSIFPTSIQRDDEDPLVRKSPATKHARDENDLFHGIDLSWAVGCMG